MSRIPVSRIPFRAYLFFTPANLRGLQTHTGGRCARYRDTTASAALFPTDSFKIKSKELNIKIKLHNFKF